MDPEETFVTFVAVALPDRLSGILVHELANHSLCDSMDDEWVGRLSVTVNPSTIGRSAGGTGGTAGHGWDSRPVIMART